MRRRRHALELAIAFLLYALLAVAASWPLVRDFSTRVLGDMPDDQRHAIWLLWHTKEALLGRQPLFHADLLYYPHGISTLVDGVGMISGLLAAPFWPWGPTAAYNGAALLGLTLSGWCMYLLVRYGATSADVAASAAPRTLSPHDDGERIAALRAAAFFAGVVFLLFPIHLAGLYGHIEKAFVGLLPLNVLAGLLAYDPARSRWWWAAPAVTLLLALLHNGNQFAFAVLALLFLAVMCAVRREAAPNGPRRFVILWPVARRALAAGALALVIVGPILAKVARVARDPTLRSMYALDSSLYTPDVLQFFVPSLHQGTVGRLVYPDAGDNTLNESQSHRSIVPALNGGIGWQGSGVETAATIPISVLALIVVACLTRRTGVVAWILFSGAFVMLALGPMLRVAGRTTFTIFELPLMLPYAGLVSVPGFDVMRTPARFMMIAAVGLAVLAAWGVLSLRTRAARRGSLVAALATATVLVECWPRVWPQQVLPPVPEFYTRLAHDPERYAVLDLPSGGWSPPQWSAYMHYQMTHRKPIAWAYLSRQHRQYPIAGLEGLQDDKVPNGPATRARLAELGYRYVVWHKRVDDLFVGLDANQIRQNPFRRPPRDARTSRFIREAFAGEVPIADDNLVTVFRVQP